MKGPTFEGVSPRSNLTTHGRKYDQAVSLKKKSDPLVLLKLNVNVICLPTFLHASKTPAILRCQEKSLWLQPWNGLITYNPCSITEEFFFTLSPVYKNSTLTGWGGGGEADPRLYGRSL